MWLTQLADIARRTGCPVIEVPGWRDRGHGPQPAVRGIVCHHTAGWGDLHVVRDGRPGLAGPLSQFWLSRTGSIAVVAAGRCWHNAPSTSPNHRNDTSIGIEAENDGRAQWTKVQLDAYRALCAELCLAFKLPASRVKGHREVNTSKVDPHSIDMGRFRSAVAQLMTGRTVKPKPTPHPGVPDEWRRPLKVGTTGRDVEQWQEAARRFVPDLAVDGDFGPKSEAACRLIQQIVGVPVTGTVTAETWLLTHIWEGEPKWRKV